MMIVTMYQMYSRQGTQVNVFGRTQNKKNKIENWKKRIVLVCLDRIRLRLEEF